MSNTYSVGYITHLVPMPARVKAMALGTLGRSRVGRVSVPVPLGNLYLIGSRL